MRMSYFQDASTGEQAALTNGAHSTKCERIYPGGDSWDVPLHQFVSGDVALCAVDEFLKTGKKNDAPNWDVIVEPD